MVRTQHFIVRSSSHVTVIPLSMRKSWRRAIRPSVCALKLKRTCVMQQNNNQKTQWCSFRASKVSSACHIKPKNRHKLNHTKMKQSPPLISDSAFIELLTCQLICAFSLHITTILLLQSTIVAVRCAYFSLTEKCSRLRLWGRVRLMFTMNESRKAERSAACFCE